jgi:hypothetical protein
MADFTSVQDGNWTDLATWGGGAFPTYGDVVVNNFVTYDATSADSVSLNTLVINGTLKASRSISTYLLINNPTGTVLNVTSTGTLDWGKTGDVIPASNSVIEESIDSPDGGQTHFDVFLAHNLVKQESLAIYATIASSIIHGYDDGNGTIYGGSGGEFGGSINYSTGELILDFSVGAPTNIVCDYVYDVVAELVISRTEGGMTVDLGGSFYIMDDASYYGNIFETRLSAAVPFGGTTVCVTDNVSSAWKSGQVLLIYSGALTGGGDFNRYIIQSLSWDGTETTIQVSQDGNNQQGFTYPIGANVFNLSRNAKLVNTESSWGTSERTFNVVIHNTSSNVNCELGGYIGPVTSMAVDHNAPISGVLEGERTVDLVVGGDGYIISGFVYNCVNALKVSNSVLTSNGIVAYSASAFFSGYNNTVHGRAVGISSIFLSETNSKMVGLIVGGDAPGRSYSTGLTSCRHCEIDELTNFCQGFVDCISCIAHNGMNNIWSRTGPNIAYAVSFGGSFNKLYGNYYNNNTVVVGGIGFEIDANIYSNKVAFVGGIDHKFTGKLGYDSDDNYLPNIVDFDTLTEVTYGGGYPIPLGYSNIFCTNLKQPDDPVFVNRDNIEIVGTVRFDRYKQLQQSAARFDPLANIVSNYVTVRPSGATSTIEVTPLSNCNVVTPTQVVGTWVEDNIPATTQSRGIFIKGEDWTDFPNSTELWFEAEYLSSLTDLSTTTVKSTAQIYNNTDWFYFPVTFTPARSGRVFYRAYLGKSNLITYSVTGEALDAPDGVKQGFPYVFFAHKMITPGLLVVEATFADSSIITGTDDGLGNLTFSDGSDGTIDYYGTIIALYMQSGAPISLMCNYEYKVPHGKIYVDNALYGAKTTVDAVWYNGDSNLYSNYAACPCLTLADIESSAVLARQDTLLEVKTKTDTINWDDIDFIKDIEGGRWRIDSSTNQMIFFEEDNSTEIARFNLYDKDGSPASISVMERTRV